mgnify:CR=1 FL=1
MDEKEIYERIGQIQKRLDNYKSPETVQLLAQDKPTVARLITAVVICFLFFDKYEEKKSINFNEVLNNFDDIMENGAFAHNIVKSLIFERCPEGLVWRKGLIMSSARIRPHSYGQRMTDTDMCL